MAGLRASDFNVKALKGKEIVEMKIDTKNESTVTVQCKDGSTERHRLPKAVIDMMEFYRMYA